MDRVTQRERSEVKAVSAQVVRLRRQRGLSQAQLAALVNTKQPSIARLESGRSEPTLSLLQRVGAALGARLEVRFVEEVNR